VQHTGQKQEIGRYSCKYNKVDARFWSCSPL